VRCIDVSVLHPPEQFPSIDDPNWPPPATDPVPERHLGDRAHWEYRALLDSICHDMSVIRLFCGLDEVDCDGGMSWGAEGGHPGSIELFGPLPAGRYSIRWHFLPLYPRYRAHFMVHHRQGSLELEFSNPYRYSIPTTLTEHGEDRRTRIQLSDTSGFEQELGAFYRMVVDGKRPLSGIAEGTADIRTARGVADSLDAWRSGRDVPHG
jgi:predicted dehydrogenase